jgi:hypothetical protein
MRRLFPLLVLFVLPLGMSAEKLTPAVYERICKGAVATLFFPPIDSVRVMKKDGTVIFLSHVRKSDGAEFRTKCRIEGSSIVWGTADGRWRTQASDEKLSFKIDPAGGTFTIRQVFGDGSSDEKTFPLE